MQAPPLLPPGITVLERGWLSSNSVVLQDAASAVIVDTGYVTHARLALDLVQRVLGDAPLARIVNTHLHSDHCGGNAILQRTWPKAMTLVPPGMFAHVQQWDPVGLSFTPTGQECEQFRADGVVAPGGQLRMAGLDWEIHAAPGHDAHAVVFFERSHGILIAGDALWQDGFGLVFPELEGLSAFDEVGRTLDLIATLPVRSVIPGHGSVFTDVPQALERARSKLAHYTAHPAKHAGHAARVLLMFKMLAEQTLARDALVAWTDATPYFEILHARWFAAQDRAAWVDSLITKLVESGALVNAREGELALG